MGRLIEDQPIASTAVDLDGEQLTDEQLRHLFAQLPAEFLINLNHDPRQPPIARASNPRIEARNGVLAILVDVEVLNEDAMDQIGGFSISYHRPYPVADPGSEDVVVSFNPRAVDPALVEDAVAASEVRPGSVLVTERADKFLVELAGVAIIYVVARLAGGFLDEAGADIYRLWKELTMRTINEARRTEVVLRSPETPESPEILLSPDPHLDPEVARAVDVAALVQQARELTAGSELARVVIEVDPHGRAYIEVAVDRNGITSRPPEE